MAQGPQDWPRRKNLGFFDEQLDPDIERSSQDPSASGRRVDGVLPEVEFVDHVAKFRMWNRTTPNFGRHTVNHLVH